MFFYYIHSGPADTPKKVPKFARVHFPEDNTKVILPIADIIEFRENPPKNLNDFDPNKLYGGAWINKKEELESAIVIADLFGMNDEKILILNIFQKIFQIQVDFIKTLESLKEKLLAKFKFY